MKSKTFRKKLTLNKKTIADLDMGKMKVVHAGGQQYEPNTPHTCDFFPTDCCLTNGCPTECTCGPTGIPGCPNCNSQ